MRSLVGRLPWWIGSALGLACAVLGAILVFRPFTSLSVLIAVVAIGMMATGLTTLRAGLGRSSLHRSRRLEVIIGLGWLAVGIAVFVWPDLSTRGLAVFVGAALVVDGVLDIVGGLRGSADERIASVIGGLASVIFGVLAWTWPDVTVLVVAVVFGARLVWAGLRAAWEAFRTREGHTVEPEQPAPRGRIRRASRVVGMLAVLVLALALAGVSARLNKGEPVVDAFYDAPESVPDQPGQLLQVEPFTKGIPDTAEAWRILYTTTRADDRPAVASGLVIVPKGGAAEARPIVAWAHGTTGVDRTCAPSVLDTGLEAGAFYLLDEVVDEGWALVATDYVGLGTEGGHPYLVGEPEARSVLDAVRAARQMASPSFTDRTVVWGHSQGGGAALWTNQIAADYADDVPLDGVAALAPASDLIGLVDNLSNVTGGSIFATYMVDGYASVYDDVDVGDYVRPAARTTFDETTERCLAEPSVIASVVGSLATDMSIFSKGLSTGALGARLSENVPAGPFSAPLLLAQGEADTLILPEVQAAYADGLCASGQVVDYRTYAGRDHVPLVTADSSLVPDLIEWTQARLAGDEPPSTC
jgi:uncharacterized membrane protein HdeD (DUF308 family)/alpha-beta hydrolase superfamily lysophospholipase